jgi:hypothetical protein
MVANTFPRSRFSSILKMEATRSSETSDYNKPTRRHIPEDDIHHTRTLRFFVLFLSPYRQSRDGIWMWPPSLPSRSLPIHNPSASLPSGCSFRRSRRAATLRDIRFHASPNLVAKQNKLGLAIYVYVCMSLRSSGHNSRCPLTLHCSQAKFIF